MLVVSWNEYDDRGPHEEAKEFTEIVPLMIGGTHLRLLEPGSYVTVEKNDALWTRISMMAYCAELWAKGKERQEVRELFKLCNQHSYLRLEIK